MYQPCNGFVSSQYLGGGLVCAYVGPSIIPSPNPCIIEKELTTTDMNVMNVARI